ncbi:hypothetical protein SacmaDRAFT_3622 [Saccharomonospora marina XMU15]|uniref:DUF7144 domain-containing protein n=1 Tax=Saccharomonospora marina XMU15 TaxID=882083 RepID=H5WYW4_9PSEU|nr:hypothetical protein [Saccharomonospora marina]EHR51836.1 hypothetical protein SacmaDRAFT_3622 [Saccharomonospora marina XMU15]
MNAMGDASTAHGRTTHERPEPQSFGWLGWVVFAGVIMILMGAFHAITGIVAILDPGFYVVGQDGLVVSVNYNAWGWVHVGVAALVILAGFGVLAGQLWARIVGIVLAVLSAIVNLAFLPAYPVWATIIIALDVVVVYALAVHGGEAKQLQE